MFVFSIPIRHHHRRGTVLAVAGRAELNRPRHRVFDTVIQPGGQANDSRTYQFTGIPGRTFTFGGIETRLACDHWMQVHAADELGHLPLHFLSQETWRIAHGMSAQSAVIG